MLPVILRKRILKSSPHKAFNKLIKYVEGEIGLDKLSAISNDQKFNDILNYSTNNQDMQIGQEKCIAIRINGVTDIATSAIEMNAVAARNTRCKDPVFHFILTWPEHERPQPNEIFGAAEHAIQSLGLAEHQYVLAVHVNTDNIHCHCAVNRIHPDTFKSRNIEWGKKTLHLAARQSEIKHGWTNENGIYIVRLNEQNQKFIILNPEHDHTIPHAHFNEEESELPAWHDPDSMDSWLKSKISRDLKQALPIIASWHELHAWLSNHYITLADSGGGGMRLHVTLQETGEVVDLPASKGLRILKRIELEKRWGKFTKAGFDNGTPPVHITHANEIGHRTAASKDAEIDADKIDNQRSLSRDNSKRAERREQRAATRADLRHRFSQYQRFVREGDVDYLKRLKEICSERSRLLKAIRDETKAAKLAVRKISPVDMSMRLHRVVEIEFERSRRKLKTEALIKEKSAKLRATRLPPLGWREWLCEQSNLGDQAAISALRGIVYQAQRDAKNGIDSTEDSIEAEANTNEYSEQQYRKVMLRLREEEKNEAAIRSTRINTMRPYEVDVLLVRYINMQWRVTGNGNIAYSDQGGMHLFTDRGNRVTFDKVLVTDEEIKLALTHAQQKFGKQLTLTGSDSIFTERMARLADDMGMSILNPELQSVIAKHRSERLLQIIESQRTMPTQNISSHSKEAGSPSINFLIQKDSHQEYIQANTEEFSVEEPDLRTSQERMRAMVLAIDPHAEFVIPDISDIHKIYIGPVAVSLTIEDNGHGFAQHIARSLYALHLASPPEQHNNAKVEIQYRDGLAVATVSDAGKEKAR